MYILPGSQQSSGLQRTSVIPDRLKALLIEGYTPIYLEGKDYYQLCQHYDHPEVDLYHYHIQSKIPTLLFSKAEDNRWVLGYILKGISTQFVYQGITSAIGQHTVLFFQAIAGKEVRLDIQEGNHTIVCCCFKNGFQNKYQLFFSTVLDTTIHYPIVLNHIGYHFQFEWEQLIQSKLNAAIQSGFVAGQWRILLGRTCEAYLTNKHNQSLQELHPGIDQAILQKAYQVKKIIESRFGASLSLKELARETQWNLQGLKSGFLKVFWLSPHQYIIQYRMKIAYDLILRSEELNIQAISITCGYKQAHHFIKQFKAVYGKTPGEVRKLES